MSSLNSFKRPSQDSEFTKKVLFFSLFVFFIIVILTIRTGYIQIVRYLEYSQKSKFNSEMVINIPPVRGKIISSDNTILADNIKTFNLYISPKDLSKDLVKLQNELLYLSKCLEMGYNELSLLIKEKNNEREVLVKENISFESLTNIQENYNSLSGLIIKENMIRLYPNNNLLSHVIGYTGIINAKELQLLDGKGYRRNDLLGKSGIELQYEHYLRGENGRRVFFVDARRNIRKENKADFQPPKSGKQLNLSIDAKYQQVVQDILSDRVGTIVVSKPATGEIIAMASYPSFNLNSFILNTVENLEYRRSLSLDTKGTPLINRSLQATYPAASIYKTISTAILLYEGLIPEDKHYYCSGSYRLNNQTFGCWSTHNSQDMEDALKNSCDVYFYNAALIIGIDRLSKYSEMFGVGKITEIDLPSERSGNNPSRQWFRSIGFEWYDGHTLNTIIGQGDVKVTPLQLLNIINIVANKGVAYKPRILKSISDPENGTNTIIDKEILSTVKMNDETYIKLTSYLRKVVSEGTAVNAFRYNPYKFAGKTGTGEVGVGQKKQTHSSFAGFGPIDYPLEEQISVIVLIEYDNGEFYRWSAPLANMVLNAWFSKEYDYKELSRKMGYPYKESYATE